MTNLESQAVPASEGVTPCRRLTVESLATLLLRLQGVYFVAWAIVGGARGAVSILLTVNRLNFEQAFAKEWTYLLQPFLELVFGLYFLLGGQWVFEKLLTPFGRDTEEDG